MIFLDEKELKPNGERTKYTTEALAKSGRWPIDFVNAFLNKDKMYTLEEAEKIISKTLKEKEGE